MSLRKQAHQYFCQTITSPILRRKSNNEPALDFPSTGSFSQRRVQRNVTPFPSEWEYDKCRRTIRFLTTAPYTSGLGFWGPTVQVYYPYRMLYLITMHTQGTTLNYGVTLHLFLVLSSFTLRPLTGKPGRGRWGGRRGRKGKGEGRQALEQRKGCC